ncbi:response regulator transcription factor [Rhodococcus sp. NPDC057014]|uniref:response regulator transcription factor n=1 Tax=Rhodococcus sp. NPDC057014 TaxID=3346000 RepID=UPI0036365F11
MTGRRILIVDDHEVVRIGFRALLCSQDWVERCFGAASIENAVEAARRWKPHVAIVKDWVGDVSVNEIAPQIAQAWQPCRILAMETVRTSRHSPASDKMIAGWIGCDWDARTLLDTVNRATTGRLAPRGPGTPSIGPALSTRQLEVLRLMMTGATNREIAQQLSLSPHTIKAHTRGLLRTLGARNRTEAALRGKRLGIADPRIPSLA